MKHIAQLQQKINSVSHSTSRYHSDSHTDRAIQRKRSVGEVKKTDPKEKYPESREKNYNKSLESGLKLMKKGMNWFTDQPNALPPISTEKTNTAVSAAGYLTFWTISGSKYELATERGSSVLGTSSGEVSSFGDVLEDWEGDLGTDVMYGNKYDAATGEFTAEGNWGNLDDEVATKEGLSARLPNSEIIWHQQALARQDYSSKTGNIASTLSSIKRSSISNKETKDTLLFCDQWPAAKAGAKITLDNPFNNDVWALLGSPNGNSTVYVLIQHGEQFGGADIRSVAYETSGNGGPPAMTITYVKR